MPKLSRRSFLKASAAVAGVSTLAGGVVGVSRAQELSKGGRTVNRTTGLPRVTIPSTCLQCQARCGILGFIEDGALVKIEGNPKDPNSRGKLCARGQAGINHLTNPDRLVYPMRRTGPRGSGQFKRISWEEAYAEVASKLRLIRDSGRRDEFVFAAGILEGTGGVASRFARAFGTNSIVEERALQLANKWTAQESSWGAAMEVYDLSRTKLILNFGSNPYDAHTSYLPLIQRLIDARINGALMVTFDPRLSNTAAKSDEWFPINPGTDAIVALAMANVIVQRGLYDTAFVESWTNYPLSRLAEYLATYTPDMAAETSGISAADIERLAVSFGTIRPAVAMSGDGVSMHVNGTQSERAIALLNVLTGNVDVPGGYCLPRVYGLSEPEPRPPAPPAAEASPSLHCASCSPGQLFAAVRSGQQKISALMTFMANPAYVNPDSGVSTAILKDETLIPYSVVADMYMTESAALADLVLPVASYIESWDVQSVPAWDMVPFVSIMQPLSRPLGESLPFADIAIELAKRIGGGMETYFQFPNMESYIGSVVAKIEGLSQAGGLDYLKANGVWYDTKAKPVYKAYEVAGFATPSGKYEVNSTRLSARGFSQLPAYEPIPTQEEAGKEELTLLTFQFNVHTYGRTAACKWLAEIVHDNPLWIHPETAREHGLHRGDRVAVNSKAGTIVTKVWVTEGINPKVVAMGACVGHWESGRIAQSVRFKSSDTDTQFLWWEKKGKGVHPYHLIPELIDPAGGGQAWLDTKVTLKKV
ncbi:MAG: twin-arginine translocation signal domain-containing protein [Chloroflexota bacterium]|nr:MAG: twin-arginine translocation signal domain-containing protein [Chloroflexota bacterium]